MKSIYATFLILTIPSLCFNQEILDNFLWGKHFQNRGLNSLIIDTDSGNNIYVLSSFTGCNACFINFEGTPLVSNPDHNNDIFLAKLDENGDLIWHYLIGGSGTDYPVGFNIDHEQNIILYIRNSETFTYDGQNFESGFNLIKLDNAGSFIWNVHIKGADHNFHNSQLIGLSKQISIGIENEIVLGGSIQDNTPNSVDSVTINDLSFIAEDHNIFVAKISSEGNLEWLEVFEHSNTLVLSGLTVADNQNINLLGYFKEEDWHINNQILAYDNIDQWNPNQNKKNTYVLQLNPSGNINWVNKYFDDIRPRNLSTDPSNNIIATGFFREKSYFQNDTLYSMPNSEDFILFKLDNDGHYQWANVAGDFTPNEDPYVLANSDNEIYLSGDFSSHLGTILAKYDADGNQIWELDPDESHNRNGGDIAFDECDALIQTGIFSGDFIIGDQTIGNSPNYWYEYILKFEKQTKPGFACDGISNQNDLEISDFEFAIFPNPVQDVLTVRYDVKTSSEPIISLSSINGHTVFNQAIDNSLKGALNINVMHLPSGSYILKLKNEQFSQSKLINVIRN